MKKVLIIAFEFPPLGSGGVIRCTKYVKYLRDYGWEPVILTVDENADIGGAKDYGLLRELPPDLEIHRTPYQDLDVLFQREVPSSKLLQVIHSLDAHFPGLLGITKPDKNITWFPTAFEKAKEIVRKGDIDLIYTDSPPNSTALLGYRLKMDFGIPWVSDFRDPWSLDELAYEALGERYHERGRELDGLLEKIILEKCDRVMVVSENLRQRYITELEFPPHQIEVFSDGYDEDDFRDIPHLQEEDPDIFKIKYMGSFYASYNPSVFLKALDRLIEKQGIRDIRFHVIGHGSQWIRQNLHGLGLTGLAPFIRLEKHMDSRECLARMHRSDLLLVISPAGMLYNVPQKIYSYMRIGSPILAVMPEGGEAGEIILDHEAGIVVDPNNIEKVEENLFMLYQKWKEGQYKSKTNVQNLDRFEKKSLTGRLCGLFEKLCDTRLQGIDELNRQGEALFQSRRHEEALMTFRKALSLNPMHPETLNNMGVVLHSLEDHEKALACFEKAIALDPHNQDALANAHHIKFLGRS